MRGDGKDAKQVDGDKLAKDLQDIGSKYEDPDLPGGKKWSLREKMLACLWSSWHCGSAYFRQGGLGHLCVSGSRNSDPLFLTK